MRFNEWCQNSVLLSTITQSVHFMLKTGKDITNSFLYTMHPFNPLPKLMILTWQVVVFFFSCCNSYDQKFFESEFFLIHD